MEYNSVKFDFKENTFEILHGTERTFSINDIERCVVLNEKASKKEIAQLLENKKGRSRYDDK